MSENDFQTQVFDDLNLQFPSESLINNKRVAIRYRRSDIKAVVKIRSRIFPRLVQVVLHDISSRGAVAQHQHSDGNQDEGKEGANVGKVGERADAKMPAGIATKRPATQVATSGVRNFA